MNNKRPTGTRRSANRRIRRCCSSALRRNISPIDNTPSKDGSNKLEARTDSQVMGVPGRLRWNAETIDGAGLTAKTCSASSIRTAVMGRPCPQPGSITLLPRGSPFCPHTSFAPISLERVLPLPRRARNSSETESYPLDRSI